MTCKSIVAFSLAIYTAFCQTVTFNNVTNLFNLSALFIDVNASYPPYFDTIYSGKCLMTNFIDTSNNNISYHWLSQSIYAITGYHNYIVNNIYDTKLQQYNNKNNDIYENLPFISVMDRNSERIDVCTSPLTNDIIVCHISYASYSSIYFKCNIFYNNGSNAFWSQPFIASPNTTISSSYVLNDTDILCFDDSYLILWSIQTVPGPGIYLYYEYYYSAIDLAGNIKYSEQFFTKPYLITGFKLVKNPQNSTMFFMQYIQDDDDGWDIHIDSFIFNQSSFRVKWINSDFAASANLNSNDGIISDLIAIILPFKDHWNSYCCGISSYWTDDGVYLSVFDYDGWLLINNQLVYNTTNQTVMSFPILKELTMFNTNKQDYYFVVIYLNIDNIVQATAYNLNANASQRSIELIKLNTFVFESVLSTNQSFVDLNWICAEIINDIDGNLMLTQSWQLLNKTSYRHIYGVFAQTFDVKLI